MIFFLPDFGQLEISPAKTLLKCSVVLLVQFYGLNE